MKTCVNFGELIAIHRPQIEEMQRVGEAFAGSEAPSAFSTFSQQVRIVDGTLRQTYREAVALAKRADDASEVAEIWSAMSSLCNLALQALASLRVKYPDRGTQELYDLALDYKLACDKRHRAAVEEVACQSKEFPKGLFPEISPVFPK
jgi:hypothetical protein